jgi:hypothetical protein
MRQIRNISRLPAVVKVMLIAADASEDPGRLENSSSDSRRPFYQSLSCRVREKCILLPSGGNVRTCWRDWKINKTPKSPKLLFCFHMLFLKIFPRSVCGIFAFA